MATATAFAHVRRALRDRLAITDRAARDVLARIDNFWAIDPLTIDLRGCVAVVGDDRRHVLLYLPDADGVIRFVTDLSLDAEHFARWEVMSLERAYGLPEGLRHMDEPTSTSIHAENDDEVERTCLDLDPEPSERTDVAFGPIPERIPSESADGTILTAAVVEGGAYLQVLVEVDGAETAFAIMPVFGTADDLVDYVAPRIGVPVRLFLERPHALHAARGMPEGMREIDMIVPIADLPSLRMAA